MDMIAGQLEQVRLLRHLPMTSLEENLKLCKSLDSSYHRRVLTPEEMIGYVTWMVEQFEGRPGFQVSPDDIPPTTGGNIAAIHSGIRQGGKQPLSLEGLDDIFQNPSEIQFFSEQQSITASRFLRHMPAYWLRSEYFEVYYVFSGQCPVWFEGEKIILSPGSVLLIPPEVKRACCCPEDDCVMFYYMIRTSTFSRIFWEQLSNQNLMSLFFRQALGGQNNTAYLRFETGHDQALETILYSIFHEYASDRLYSSQMTNSLMSIFFLHLLQNYEQTAQVSKQSSFHWKPEFAAMFSYIQEHYQTVTLEELSDVFNYSQRQIIRIIQSSTNKTFTQLLTQLRMERVPGMLVAKEVSMEQIAAAVGYSSVGSFYRVFVNYYGITPGEWRKKRQ